MKLQTKLAAGALITALCCFPFAIGAFADRDGDEEGERVPAVTDQVVLKECGACHMAFQPSFLPAESWRKIMAGLKNHFGENAELDEATAKRIADYLTANASRWGGYGAGNSLRITEAPWFVRKHEKHGRLSPASLKRAGAKSPADCAACHPGAAKGYYEDD